MRVRDPVCGMEVETSRAAARHGVGDATYYFCSEVCRTRFAKDPDRYIATPAPAAPHEHGTRARLSRAVRAVGVFAVSLLVLSYSGTVAAADIDLSKRADGVIAYLGVLPSAMIEGVEESAAHGGPKGGKHRVHVLVALFDATTSARIEDATVTARVAPVGLGGAEKPLEAMAIAGTRTYGNYFDLPERGLYAITVEVLRPGMSRAIDIRFTYEHALQ